MSSGSGSRRKRIDKLGHLSFAQPRLILRGRKGMEQLFADCGDLAALRQKVPE